MKYELAMFRAYLSEIDRSLCIQTMRHYSRL